MRKYIIIGVILLSIALPVLIAFLLKSKTPTVKNVTLKFWGVEDQAADFADIIKSYQGLHPYVKISYTPVKLELYKDNLIKGWAKDQGPDIFVLPNTWISEFQEFLLPIPQSTKVVYYQTKKVLCKKQTEISSITQKSITSQELKNQYIDVVYPDVVRKDAKQNLQIYGLPLSIDTLVLYYNKNLLNNAQFVEPAKTWGEIIQHVPKLTKLDAENNILQSGLALGLSDNINYYFDILSLLMMQNGTNMTDSTGKTVAFNRSVASEYNPGERALEFYTDFANLSKEVYAWNKNQQSSLDGFIRGKVAYYIGYQKDKATIDTKSSGLNYGIASIPHINEDGTDSLLNPAGNPIQINYANYWIYTVSQKTKYPNEAWNFIQYMANEKRAKSYLAKTKKISVLKSILTSQINDLDLGVFAAQTLTASTWYRGKCASETTDYFKTMIDRVANKEDTALNSLNLAAKQIQETLQNTCQ
jgi:ABC-type glycerol-3-phosphate transport system substrate-binding protein